MAGNGKESNLDFLLSHDSLAKGLVEFDELMNNIFRADALALEMEIDQVRDEAVLGQVYWGNYYANRDATGQQVAASNAAAAKAAAPQMGR